MKKYLYSISAAMVLLSLIILTMPGCKKDDTTAPVISLNGTSPLTVSLNAAYTDPGATASDDNDGTVSVTSDASGTNPNVNLVGSYTITYHATDAAGNKATATRTVNVRNDAYYLVGTYLNAYDTCSNTPASHFDATVTTSTTINNKITINNFAAFGTNVNVDLSVSSTGAITGLNMPQSLGGGAQLDVIYSSGPASAVITQTSPVQFVVHYHWIDASSNQDECISTYTR